MAYDWEVGPCLTMNLGASVQGGQIYNHTTRRMGDRFAYAFHSDLNYGDWNFQLQWIDYVFRPDNPPDVDPSTVQLAAFRFPFLIAAHGQVATINLAKTFLLGWPLLDSAKFYSDFSKVFPDGNGTHDSTQIVIGCLLVTKEHLYTYVDWVFGDNMWFIGGPGVGLGQPGSDEWQSRLNVNLGFYF